VNCPATVTPTQMHSQRTPQEVIVSEKQRVRGLLNLTEADTMTVNDSGWDSRVYIVNQGQYVFKFPRSEQVRAAYASEIAAYKLVSAIRSSVKTPVVKWEGATCEYFGYEGIVGTTLDVAGRAVSGDAWNLIGTALGAFLVQLHQLDLQNARQMSINDEIEEFQYKYSLGLLVIQQKFTDDEQGKIERLIQEDLPSKLTELGGDMVLCHGDLGYWNIIYGRGGEIGVIDFGDVGYYDRSKDFIGLKDVSALNAALSVYGDNAILREKIALRKKVLAILDLPFFIGKNDQSGINSTVHNIRRAIS